MDEIIMLDYGSGGKKTSRLIENMLLPAFSNAALEALGDGAILPGAEKLVFPPTASSSRRSSSRAATSASSRSAVRSTTSRSAAAYRNI